MAIIGACMVPHPPIILPEVGRGQESAIAATTAAYEAVGRRICELRPETIVISTPHSVMYSDYFHVSPGREATGDMSRYNAPEVSFTAEYDTELVAEIERQAAEADFPAGTYAEKDPTLDHGTLIPLYFICKAYREAGVEVDLRIIRVGLSTLPLPDQYRMGQLIRCAVDALDRRVYYVASGDLSHKMKEEGPYGFAPEGPVYDERIMRDCSAGDFGALLDYDEGFCDRAAECGHRSFVMMAGALDGLRVEAKAWSHEATFGVGYGICTFEIPAQEELSDDRRFLEQWIVRKRMGLPAETAADPCVRLARETVARYVLTRHEPGLSELEAGENVPAELLKRRAGTFVSIHEHGELRGCIGTILPTTDCIALEILQNAVSACSRDPRFSPVRAQELSELEISVDVLGEPEPIDSPDELDVHRYGVIVTSGSKRGLLLPDLEGVDSVAQQIDIARRKGGIGPFDKISLQRFEVVRHI